MANANTNLMSINLNQSTTSTGANSKNSQLHSKYKSGKGDFNAALNNANDQISRQEQFVQQNPSESEEIQYTEATAQNPKSPVESKDAKTSPQGQNSKTQDAPQNLPNEKNIPAEIQVELSKNILTQIPTETENVSPNLNIKTPEVISPLVEIKIETPDNLDAPEIQSVLPYVFTTNTETLLQTQPVENSGEVNLMAVIPQSDGNKEQKMLNLLSGKTWTSDDVQKATLPQNVQPADSNIEALPLHQSAKNFTLNPTQTLNSQNLNPQDPNPQNLNSLNLNPENTQQLNLNTQLQSQISLKQVNPNPDPSMQFQIQKQLELQNQPILDSLQPQIDPKQINQPKLITELLNVNLQAEENQNVAPLSPIIQTPRQQPEQNPQQSPSQNFQQMTSQDAVSEVQTQSQNFGVEESFAQNLAPVVENISTNQPVVQTQTPEAAAQAPREDFNVPTQIVEQARLIRNSENTEMVINLKPEHLGQLTLRISVSQNGAVNASFYSDSAQVRTIIENSIVQLKQELNDQGLKVENVQVYAGLTEGGLTNGQGQQAWQQNQQQHSNRRIDFDALQEEVDAVTPVNEDNSTDGVDYKI